MGGWRPMTIEELVARLEEADVGLRRNGTGWRGNCPACGGSDRLVVGEDLNSRPYLKCWGRCERDDVLGAVNLSWRDLRGAAEEEEADVEAIRHALFVEPRGLVDGEQHLAREPLEGGAEMLYRGQATTVFSERGAGKSTLATLLGVSVAATGGRVYYWDRENTVALTGARVRAILDAHEDWPDPRGKNFIYAEYPRLDPDWNAEALGEVFDGFALVVYDSMREAIAQLGGDPNVERDISNFVSLAVTPITARGGAVLALDNTGHEHTNRPRGSGAKLDVFPQAFKCGGPCRSRPSSSGESRSSAPARASATRTASGRWRSAPAPGICRGLATRTPTSGRRERSPTGAGPSSASVSPFCVSNRRSAATRCSMPLANVARKDARRRYASGFRSSPRTPDRSSHTGPMATVSDARRGVVPRGGPEGWSRPVYLLIYGLKMQRSQRLPLWVLKTARAGTFPSSRTASCSTPRRAGSIAAPTS